MIIVSIKRQRANVVATINHNEYKDVLLNKKCLKHSMNRIHKATIIEYELMKSTRFLCPALMKKYTSKRMDVMDLVLVIRANYKKQLP